MQVKQLVGIKGARKATGITVIIDIMRAATVEAYAFGQGAKEIIPVATKEEAFSMKRKNPNVILIGEERGIKVDGFNFGNSPSEIASQNLKGRVLVHRTSSGIQALVSATHASELIFGSFVTCSAIIKYIKSRKDNNLSIVSVDSEDLIFAKYLESSMKGDRVDKKRVRKDLVNDPGISWFLDPTKPEFNPIDIDYALDFDRFNFICYVKKINNKLRITPLFI